MLKQFLLKVKQTNVQEVCLSVKQKNQQEWKKKKQNGIIKLIQNQVKHKYSAKIKIYTLKWPLRRK